MPTPATGRTVQDKNEVEKSGGQEYGIKLETEANSLYRKVFAVREMSITEAARETAEEPTLDSGTSTLVGPRGAVTASMTLGRNTEASGQHLLLHAHASDLKVNIRRVKDTGKAIKRATIVSGDASGTKINAHGNANKPLQFVKPDDPDSALQELFDSITQGMYLKVTDVDNSNAVSRYFIEEVHVDSNNKNQDIFISPGVTGNSEFSWDGSEVTFTANDIIELMSGRMETIVYTGSITSPPQPADSASTTPTVVTGTVEFALDDSGERSYVDPASLS